MRNIYFIDLLTLNYYFFFFFQAEDGIRDLTVTGVQTCALPISNICAEANILAGNREAFLFQCRFGTGNRGKRDAPPLLLRSEERRVGKECRSRWSADH